MKKILLSLSLILSAFNAIAQSTNCTNLIISEYVEGTGNNKAIELYNASAGPISLSTYRLIHFNNGADSATTLGNATGDYILNLPTNVTLASGQTYVIVVDLRNPAGTGSNAPVDLALQAKADTFLCSNCAPGNVRVMCYNGNDALALQQNGFAGYTNVDIFGIMGDPSMTTAAGGVFWTDGNGANWTRDHSLKRKNTVLSGVVSNPSFFDPSIEYDSLPKNTFTNLRSHLCNCPVVAGVNKVVKTNDIKIVNPIENKTLELINVASTVKLEVYDVTGKLVISKTLAASANVKCPLNLNAGIYYAKVKSAQIQSTKIIIE
jgi:Lamin Tail Domain